MRIVINIDVMLAKRKMKLNTLAEKVGISVTNLSLLKTGKAKGLRFATLLSICEALDCEPGDIIGIEESDE
ncbi:helix-turn-helix transcriptional regulator [Roseivirga sp. E12]|uniref:helix-turn-helix domain-containing protein n=1 Tax=Roseivirga sp. E12 TaxID=2819237 RepID=UPI001ABC3A6D|nr:helix-turn-helix transcriptional regulator [Roseivirga sp. E12]MBO3697753.1 helix-turn-helix transcriptional regulator [Roseivirga sp. E12]